MPRPRVCQWTQPRDTAMKYGLDIPTAGAYADARKLADLAADAEAAGRDGCFIWDILFAKNQPPSPLAP